MPLTRRQTIELAAAIRERRDALVKELGTDTADRNDPVEAADTDRDVAELKELEAAAARLDQGRYGACADCGADIEVERLFARPGTTRCIACQRRHEKTHATPERSSL
ncbi:MAG TPA: TraR/DksA family transcriptional regulator [Burkholderiales bacterium]|nr:TraR/DksA family transcriptional regulator [Burkholderiales bacterium]